MAEKTIIAWTDYTFNPWMGCTKVSDGCKFCYAEALTKNRMGLSLWGPRSRRQVTSIENWKKPVAWNALCERTDSTKRVFSGSLCDVFEDHPRANETRGRFWDLIRQTPRLAWQLLTKRPERILDCLPKDWGAGWPNVWLGTSIEDIRVARRADELRRIPAVVRFVSYEPALGPLDDLDLYGLDWIIYGGESGPNFRPHDLEWARTMREKCRRNGVAFFFKQSAAFRTETGTTLDGEIVRDYPVPRTVSAQSDGQGRLWPLAIAGKPEHAR